MASALEFLYRAILLFVGFCRIQLVPSRLQTKQMQSEAIAVKMGPQQQRDRSLLGWESARLAAICVITATSVQTNVVVSLSALSQQDQVHVSWSHFMIMCSYQGFCLACSVAALRLLWLQMPWPTKHFVIVPVTLQMLASITQAPSNLTEEISCSRA